MKTASQARNSLRLVVVAAGLGFVLYRGGQGDALFHNRGAGPDPIGLPSAEVTARALPDILDSPEWKRLAPLSLAEFRVSAKRSPFAFEQAFLSARLLLRELIRCIQSRYCMPAPDRRGGDFTMLAAYPGVALDHALGFLRVAAETDPKRLQDIDEADLFGALRYGGTGARTAALALLLRRGLSQQSLATLHQMMSELGLSEPERRMVASAEHRTRAI